MQQRPRAVQARLFGTTAAVLLSLLAASGSPARSTQEHADVEMRGELTRADYERVIEHPFTMPPEVTSIEISLEHTGREERTVLDLGVRGPTALRGWSGGRERTVRLSLLSATPGYLPGPIEAGRWSVLVGVPNIREGRRDSYVIRVSLGKAERMATPVLSTRAGWYRGDLHVHSGHSDGRGLSASGQPIPAPPHRVFERAAAAGLDFVLLSDHNTASHWLDVDRLQPSFDGLLLLHGREVTTYRGHANTTGERAFLPFHPATPATSPAAVLRAISDEGAFVSINHPLLPDDERCMGCGWNDRTSEVLRSVQGVEVINGPTRDGPQSGWRFWSELLSQGYQLTAVGGSDDHTPDDPIDRQPGTPSTVVWAQELSEAAIVAGLKSGRVYVRARGGDGPHLDIAAHAGAMVCAMGSRCEGAAGTTVRLVADVQHAAGQELVWIRAGREVATALISDVPLATTLRVERGEWVSALVRDADGVTAISNAIYFR